MIRISYIGRYTLTFLFLFWGTIDVHAQKDTLRVMAYNVLYYGEIPNCQGPNATYHNYLKTIIQYANPDIIGLEKMGSVKLTPSDNTGTAPYGFADSVLQFALNAAYPGRYAYCTFTNTAGADNMSVLFYNQQKLGFITITSSYSNITDFNTYKLYYKDPNLSATHDTTYLYATLNHDQSGSDEITRDEQIAGEMEQMAQHFSHLPNMINMGDFNTRNSNEGCYQTLTATTDTGFLFSDPPFYPDNELPYPADWDDNPASYTDYLTTSTREANIPNSCGTTGGGKSWYDHIFLSPWVVNNANYIRYIPQSYRTIGNDGHRVGISVNDSSTQVNASAPSNVINALFQMSNKYPVMVDLEVSMNTTGISPADPEIPLTTGINRLAVPNNYVSVTNPIRENTFMIRFSPALIGQRATIQCYDENGRLVMNKAFNITGTAINMPCNFNSGVYFLKIFSENSILYKGVANVVM